jgi:hypothetical protein
MDAMDAAISRRPAAGCNQKYFGDAARAVGTDPAPKTPRRRNIMDRMVNQIGS